MPSAAQPTAFRVDRTACPPNDVVRQPVEQCAGKPLGSEGLGPFIKGQIDAPLDDALRQVQAIAAEDAAPDDQAATDPQRTDS